MPKKIDLSGKKINHITIIKRIEGTRKYICHCDLCNKTYEMNDNRLRNGTIQACFGCVAKLNGERAREKLEGTVIGNWSIGEYLGNSKYLCTCKCGNPKILRKSEIKNRYKHGCAECSNRNKSDSMREHLENKTFGQLHVEKYLGEYKYLCRCSCNNTHITTAYLLKNGISTRCNKCSNDVRSNLYRETMLARYEEVSASKLKKPRENWQIEVLNNKDKLKEYISKMEGKLGRLPTSFELACELNISVHILLTYTRSYCINLYSGGVSRGELEIRDIMNSIEVKYNDKYTINPLELDFYIPSKKIAIEFNGTYWHSSEFKEYNYHQNKTLACAKSGIQLIHIFEYEWNDENKKQKIINMLRKINGDLETEVIYARSTVVREISAADAHEFEDKFHLQGRASASVCIGMYIGDKLIGIMTFGKPRFNNNYEWELVRLCYNTSFNVVGGTEKMFKYFTNKYSPKNIITYSDISKFTGSTYIRIGFKPLEEGITKPNYVWVNPNTNNVMTRYQTQKNKLIALGIGTETETEDEIMLNLGYYKIYDSGNLKLIWNNTKEETNHE